MSIEWAFVAQTCTSAGAFVVDDGEQTGLRDLDPLLGSRHITACGDRTKQRVNKDLKKKLVVRLHLYPVLVTLSSCLRITHRILAH